MTLSLVATRDGTGREGFPCAAKLTVFLLLLFPGSLLDASGRRTAAGSKAEKDQLLPNADRVRTDAIRNPDGGHPVPVSSA